MSLMKNAKYGTAKKMTAGLALAAVLSVGLLGSSDAHAQAGIDPQTRDMLIAKLTQVYLNLAPADTSKVAITLRLADLHAERARMDAMKELQAGCTQCTAGVADRKKALHYYQEVLPKTPDTSIGKVLAQVGHLYEMTGDQKAAVATYTRILTDQKSPEARAEAHISLAELYFKRRDYALARKHYGEVIANPQASSKGLAAYRIAWCEFNDGRLQPATDGLVAILKSPELLSRNAAAGVIQVDKQFQEEVSRDLATFIARRTMAPKEASAQAAQLHELSPENAKIANVTHLASELERLGQAQSSIAVWRFTQEKQAKPQARLEGHVRLAQLQMEQKMTNEAAKDYAQALAMWTSMGTCNATDCSELKARLRKFVVDWNRMEKKAPSEGLLEAYKGYLKTFPTEGDMALWAAIVASDMKQHALAFELYNKTATLANETLASKTTDATQKKEAGERLETSLLGAIEVAEEAKDAKKLDQAYDSYLAMSREKKKALEVRYQKAKAIYDGGDNATAADALKAVALSKEPGSVELKEQAAELALDALVLMKDDTRLEAWSSELAQAFPKNAGEFRGIARKSILTQSTATAEKGDKASLETAWATLMRFELQTATPEDKASFYKNKLILAEKTGRYSEARDAVENMLRIPSLTAADQQYALSRKAWLAELVLDFDTALQATQKLEGPEFSGEKKWLKLAMYAELANKDAKPFYGQFLKDSKDEEKNVAIAAQLVRDSKEPLKEIEKSKALLAKRPAVLADLYLDVFAKTGSLDIAKKALAQAGVNGTSSGKVLTRALLLDEYSKLKARVSGHQLDGSNQKKMAQTLKARVALLEDTEKLVTKAIESADWTVQLVTLDMLAKQNDRFYQEVLALPVPAGLSEEEQGQYLQLLAEQAAPHQTRAADVTKKVGEFWSQTSATTAMSKDLDAMNGPVRALLVKEVQTLADVAPEAKKAELLALAAKQENAKVLPALATLETARKAVRETPMSRDRLEALLSLEKQMGRQTMVAYLEGRLATLEGASK
ncbi:MAG: hypothetical protein V4760_04965 [Bdellovibrionota bacterium]